MRKEEALELLKSMYETKKYVDALDYAASHLEGSDRSKVLQAREMVATEHAPLDAFFAVGLLDERTYNFLKMISEKSVIEGEVIDTILREENFRQRARKALMATILQPMVMVFLVGVVAVFMINTSMKNYYSLRTSGLELSIPMEFVYGQLASFYPFSMFLFPAVLVVVMRLVVGFLLRIPNRYSLLASIAMQIYYLRSAKVSYAQIFESLADIYPNLATFFSSLADKAMQLRGVEIIHEVLSIYPKDMRIVPVMKMMRGEELSAWKYLADKSEEAFQSSTQKVNGQIPIILSLVMSGVVVFAIFPSLAMMMSLMDIVR